MKKIFALILCFMLLLAPLSVSAEEAAEGGIADVTETEGVGEDNSVSPEETPAEDEVLPPETIPEETPETVPDEPSEKIPEAPTDEGEGTSWGDVKDTISGTIKEWIEPNIEEISVVITLVGYGIILFKKLKTVLKSMGVLNNNAITIAKDSKTGMDGAAEAINNAANAILAYEIKINTLLEKYEQAAEDKLRLENELVEIKSFLKTATDSNVEFANELAELLGLANIPNYKKEEIGSRHLAAVNAIIEAEKKAESLALPAPVSEEVKEDDGEEA